MQPATAIALMTYTQSDFGFFNQHAGMPLLPLAVPVLVQNDRGCCLAYRDRTGQWRTFFGNHPLDGNVMIVPDRIGGE